MNCYNCYRTTLGPVLLDPGLPAKACPQCGGVHIDLLTYRSWRDDGYASLLPADLLEVVPASDNHTALICQGCAKMMLKFRISSEYANFVDVCTHCNTVWLDSGEWDLLRHLDLQGKLTEMMSEPWQKHLRGQFAEHTRDDVYRKRLGDETFAEIEKIAIWIENHERRADLLGYLRRRAGD